MSINITLKGYVRVDTTQIGSFRSRSMGGAGDEALEAFEIEEQFEFHETRGRDSTPAAGVTVVVKKDELFELEFPDG